VPLCGSNLAYYTWHLYNCCDMLLRCAKYIFVFLKSLYRCSQYLYRLPLYLI
jgi:hypothetical protein